MKTLPLALFLLLAALLFPAPVPASPALYELRTYHVAPGKAEALQARFRDHTLRLFAKHGITSVGYWTAEPEDGAPLLVFLLSYPDRESREARWEKFIADPEWVAAKAASETEGTLVAKAEIQFLVPVDYSPGLEIEAQDPPRLFEWRVYTTREGKLPAIDARFRDHTMALFARHGMTNLIYFHLAPGQEGESSTLLYLLAHRDEEAMKASFAAFRQDPDWVAARDASEAEGPILVEKGVRSLPLRPLDFSPLK